MDFKESHPNSSEGTGGRRLTTTNPRAAGGNEHQCDPSAHNCSQPYSSRCLPTQSKPLQFSSYLGHSMQVDKIHGI